MWTSIVYAFFFFPYYVESNNLPTPLPSASPTLLPSLLGYSQSPSPIPSISLMPPPTSVPSLTPTEKVSLGSNQKSKNESNIIVTATLGGIFVVLLGIIMAASMEKIYRSWMNGEKSSNVKGMDRTRSFRRKEKSKLIASRYTKYSSEETIDDFLKEAGYKVYIPRFKKAGIFTLGDLVSDIDVSDFEFKRSGEQRIRLIIAMDPDMWKNFISEVVPILKKKIKIKPRKKPEDDESVANTESALDLLQEKHKATASPTTTAAAVGSQLDVIKNSEKAEEKAEEEQEEEAENVEDWIKGRRGKEIERKSNATSFFSSITRDRSLSLTRSGMKFSKKYQQEKHSELVTRKHIHHIPFNSLELEQRPFGQLKGRLIFKAYYMGFTVGCFQQDNLPKSTQAMNDIENEVATLTKLAHESVLCCYGSTRDEIKGTNFQIFELCSGGNLKQFYGSDLFTREDYVRVVTEILQGVLYIHNQNVSYLNIKAENMMLSDPINRKVKISLSPSCSIDDDSKFVYLAPEMFRNNSGGQVKRGSVQDGKDVDIYALGIVLWELWFKMKPWQGVSLRTMIKSVRSGKRLTFESHDSVPSPPSSLQELIQWCWEHDKSERIRISNALAYFKSVTSISITNFSNEVTTKGGPETVDWGELLDYGVGSDLPSVV